MATLQIRNFPDELHAKLAERAHAAHMTMSAYATGVLERDLDQMTMHEWVAALDKALPTRGGAGLGIDAAELINQIRDENEDYLMEGILGQAAQAA
ncbi:MAG: hypothetical protein FWF75_03695 [Propionibacteriaceae bacterium]|nr:hypothetical protein [Propionibacteriaceae bacterium]